MRLPMRRHRPAKSVQLLPGVASGRGHWFLGPCDGDNFPMNTDFDDTYLSSPEGFEALMLRALELYAPPGLARMARAQLDEGAELRLVIDCPPARGTVRARVRVVVDEGRNFWVPLVAWRASEPTPATPE